MAAGGLDPRISLSVGLLRGSFRGSDTVAEPDGHNLYTLIIIEYY
jgi:hypothetical protein